MYKFHNETAIEICILEVVKDYKRTNSYMLFLQTLRTIRIYLYLIFLLVSNIVLENEYTLLIIEYIYTFMIYLYIHEYLFLPYWNSLLCLTSLHSKAMQSEWNYYQQGVRILYSRNCTVSHCPIELINIKGMLIAAMCLCLASRKCQKRTIPFSVKVFHTALLRNSFLLKNSNTKPL